MLGFMYNRFFQRAKTISTFFFLAICAACTNISDVESAQTISAPTSRPINQDDTSQKNADYQTVYQDGEFVVREMFLGNVADWKWDNFVMPEARIQDSTHEFNFGREMICDSNSQDAYRCKESFELYLDDGRSNTFALESEYQFGNGKFILKKNQQIIYAGHMNGGTAFPIHSLVRYKDDIALDYVDGNYDGVNPSFWKAYYILIIDGDNVSLIESAFAPNVVNDNLIYFKKDSKNSLVYNGKEIGSKYDLVFNQFCCWDGPPIQIHGNGKIIDFFATRNGGWYHIQAGYQN